MNASIWHNLSQGDRIAYAEIYTTFYGRLFNYAHKFTSDESLIEDSVQELFILLWKNRKKFYQIQSPQSYLFYMFRNHLFLLLKKQKKRRGEEKKIKLEPEFDVENIIIKTEMDREKKAQLEKAIYQLPSRQREALFLRFYEGISYKEIAQIMEITVPSAHKTIYKALTHLRKASGIELGMLLLIL